MKDTEGLKAMLTEKPSKKNTGIKSRDLLSTGSTLLNLACSGRIAGGFPKGKYIFIVGDSSSGKTWLSLTCLAEASINPQFDDYRFIYDNGEDGALMDISKFFGSKVAKRLEAPAMEEGEPVYSSTIEEFYDNLDDAIQEGRPFIYIQDSMDVLTSDAESEKFQEQKTARRKGKDTTGSYGDGKAKKNSSNIRRVLRHLRQTGSILIIISQTRDNIGFGAQFNPKTRSGGKALRFYACLEMWSSIREKIKKDINGKKRQLGIICEVEVKKNRLTGKETTVQIPLYHSFGIDDVGACIDYLLSEGHWSKKTGGLSAPEFEFSGSREKLIKKIEDEDLGRELQTLVSSVWREIAEKCSISRKSRYHDD